MDEIFMTYGQGIMAAFSTIVLFSITAHLFVNGLFAEYISYVLSTIFG